MLLNVPNEVTKTAEIEKESLSPRYRPVERFEALRLERHLNDYAKPAQ